MYSSCVLFSAEQEEEPTVTYQDVTIDSTHKVSEHYTVMEKLGV